VTPSPGSRPRFDGHVRVFPTDGDVGVGRVRDAKQCILDSHLDIGELSIKGVDALAGCDRRCLQLRDLRAVG
jgi:hypothetical protein